ncbi:MAG: glycosyltransferase family 2 protein [Bacteroidales bacterium]|nr:glycosyltransferase family 2 protein [Clostridium sp.]MCM1202915.1 glycosyltransferase family 2 protein [Bacteroidales bacterium]
MVQILMATYNGEKYLREQLDSLLKQTYQDIQILIRDDASSDGTVEILAEYSRKYSNINYYEGHNIGAQKSFFDLFAHVDKRADFIAACDQDDVWYADKLETALKALEMVKEPALYCGRTQLTDENLNPLEDKLRKKSPKVTFGNALIESTCTGCTMVINRALYDFIDGRWPAESLIHDWWFCQVALGFGRVIYDDEPHIFYRQHANNTIGLDNSRLSLIKRQIRSFPKFKGKYTAQMEEFIHTFSLSGENKYLAELMVGTRHSWKCRVKVLFEKRIFRQGKIDTLLFKCMLGLGLL